MAQPQPIKGLQLSELFYREAVAPIIAAKFPELQYSAARINAGSDVLGFDDQISRDHYWGAILELYFSGQDYHSYRDKIDEALRAELPREIAGFPTNFDSTAGDASAKHSDSGPIEHRISFYCIDTFVHSYRSINPLKEMTVLDWLMIPSQKLRTIRSGKVFYDGLGELEAIRAKLHYYPEAVWRHLLVAQWCRISQEMAFPGRCGDVGDELGSRIVAARLVQDLMNLCFLMERRYAPYSKWFGTAFAQLNCAGQLTPIFHGVLNAQGWRERERYMSQAYEIVGEMHNALEITAPLPVTVKGYFSRPYLVVGSNYGQAIYETIIDEEVKRLPLGVGSVDQFLNSTDVLDNQSHRSRLAGLYDGIS